MNVRRVVTGHDEDGKSILRADGNPPRTTQFVHVPGLASPLVWATPSDLRIPISNDPTPAVTNFVPTPGATRFIVVTFPPDSVFGSPDFNPQAARKEHLDAEPGLAETFEAHNPGMHTTPTVDYGVDSMERFGWNWTTDRSPT